MLRRSREYLTNGSTMCGHFLKMIYCCLFRPCASLPHHNSFKEFGNDGAYNNFVVTTLTKPKVMIVIFTKIFG